MQKKYLNDEKGSVLLITVVVLLVISVVVLMGANNSLFELKLAGNDRCLTEMKSNAESAALAGYEKFKALGDDSTILRNTGWYDTSRVAWYHKGEGDCVVDPAGFNSGDLNRDGEVDGLDGENGLERARAFSQTFFGGGSSEDNWTQESCAELTDSNGHTVTTMENAKFMVIDTGPPPAKIADSMGLSMDPAGNRSWHQILVTGVDEKCGGKYMVQIAYLVRF